MTLPIDRGFVKEATDHCVWDLGNEVLYGLCRKHPDHKRADAIVAKVWLIGRSYAAAIERRRKGGPSDGDAFYEKEVVRALQHLESDEWFRKPEDTAEALWIHWKLMRRFHKLTGQDKRSLASKYLHFHFRDHFYIYDTRALAAVTKILQKGKVPRKSWSEPVSPQVDREYARFFRKCIALNQLICEELGVPNLSPRDLDKVLLKWDREHPPKKRQRSRSALGA